MANSVELLQERLKNEYSTQYSLVIDGKSFYPEGGTLSTSEKEQKIAQSAVAGKDYKLAGSAPPTEIDPFRQCMGRIWTFRKLPPEYQPPTETGLQQIPDLSYFHAPNKIWYGDEGEPKTAIEFGENEQTYPFTYFSSANTDIKSLSFSIDDVSDDWYEFFGNKNAYNDSLILKRKASRISIMFDNDDILQNRLTILSMITDIQKKNQTVAYAGLAADVDTTGKTNTADTLEDVNTQLEAINIQIDTLEGDLANTTGDTLNPITVSDVEKYQSGWSGSTLQDKLNDHKKLKTSLSSDPDANNTAAELGITFSEYYTKIYSSDGGTTYKTNLITSNDGAFSGASLLNLVNYLYEEYEKSPAVGSSDGLPMIGESGFTLGAFSIWIMANRSHRFELAIEIESLKVKRNELEQEIGILEDQLQTLEGDITLETTMAEAASISFLPPQGQSVFGTLNYNFDSVLRKRDLPLKTEGSLYNYNIYSDLPNWTGQDDDPSPVTEVFKSLWSQYTLKAIDRGIDDALMDKFYSIDELSYAHDPRLMYKDAAFMMQLPMSPRAMQAVNTPNKNELFVDIKPRYNYYSKFYEAATKQKVVYSQELNDDGTKKEYKFNERNIGTIYEVPLDEDPDGSPKSVLNGVPTPTRFNFEKYGHKLLNCDYSANLDGMYNYRNFNIILDQNSTSFLDKYDNVKTQFPFYVNFEFKCDKNKDFGTLFNQTGITTDLMQTWIRNFFRSHGNASPKDTDQVLPNKEVNISQYSKTTSNSGEKYYDPLDSNEQYRKLIPEDDPSVGIGPNRTAEICRREIYKINEKKDFYKIVPPTDSKTADESYLEQLQGFNLIKETTGEYNCREFDLNKWVEGYAKAFADSDGYSSWFKDVMLTDDGLNEKVFSDSGQAFGFSEGDGTIPRDDLEKTIQTILFLGKYRQLVNEKSRDYNDILSGKLAHSEVLFYRIQKVAVDPYGTPDEDGFVQNFWLVKPNYKENENNSDIMRYIDTQVRYEQNYEYTIYAYQLVVGTRYGFHFANNYESTSPYSLVTHPSALTYASKVSDFAKNKGNTGYEPATGEYLYTGTGPSSHENNLFYKPQNPDSKNRLAMFDVICEPDVKLIEMPYYKKTVVVNDAASTAPEVDIVPLRGQDNQIKINFYPSSVGVDLEPFFINTENSELEKYDKIRKSQDRDLLTMEFAEIGYLQTSGVEFSQDLPATFPPEAYVEPKLMFKSDDFATHYEIYRFDEPPTFASIQNSLLLTMDALHSSSYTDTIEQNKKYYYMFRSIDVHGNPSYPSQFYQVEMVENSGAVYPVISVYNPEPQQTGLKRKSFKKRLKIDAAAMQSVFDTENSDFEGITTAGSNAVQTILLGKKSEKLFTEADAKTHKKFKFRIKSKHTGKIVDLNVSFKLRTVQPEVIISCEDEVTPATLSDLAEQTWDADLI